jgi:hypothetical protein
MEMAGQVPERGTVVLDHIAHFVPRIDRAAEAMRRCGFLLTPFAVQTNRAGGEPAPAGTGNRCAMLRQGYVEILAATADTPLARELEARIAHHVGLHLLAFGTADAAVEHRRLEGAGVAMQPLVEMRRPAAGGGEAHFTIARLVSGLMPEGRVQFVAHHTPELVWREGWLDHPNGARSLERLLIAADDPGEAAERFARIAGRPARHEGEGAAIPLDRGELTIATPAALRRDYGIEPGPEPPYLAGYEVTVDSLARLHALLAAENLPHRPLGDRLAVALPPGLGGTILFHSPAG